MSDKSHFTSDRERRLWGWATLAVVTIFATLGLAGALAERIGDSGVDAVTFVAGLLLVGGAAIAFGMRARFTRTNTFVVLGVIAIYVLVLTRLASPVERSHLIEYGVVALLIYAALLERRSNGGNVRLPAVWAIVVTAGIGVVDEMVQGILPDRVLDPVDMVFNALAALMAVSAAVVVSALTSR